MNSRTIWLFSMVLLSWSEIAHGGKKVALCHALPGHPANLQTISVGEAAVSAHLAHGDQVGACAVACSSGCDDVSLCTSDSCRADGQCVHSPVSCDEGVVCTRDEGDPAVGCLRLPNDGLSCDDGTDGTSADRCDGGECRGTPIAGCCARRGLTSSMKRAHMSNYEAH